MLHTKNVKLYLLSPPVMLGKVATWTKVLSVSIIEDRPESGGRKTLKCNNVFNTRIVIISNYRKTSTGLPASCVFYSKVQFTIRPLINVNVIAPQGRACSITTEKLTRIIIDAEFVRVSKIFLRLSSFHPCFSGLLNAPILHKISRYLMRGVINSCLRPFFMKPITNYI